MPRPVPDSEPAFVLSGTLIREDRAILLFLAVLTLVLIIVADEAGPTATLVSTGLLAALLLPFLANRQWLHERIRIVLDDAGVELHRRGGRRQRAAWRIFESAPIAYRRPSREFAGPPLWRLTLYNRFKPAIASFLHLKDSENSIFFFPLAIEFESESELVRALEQRIATALGSFEVERSTCLVRLRLT